MVATAFGTNYLKKECIVSPIFYMGNKKKLINKGLVELFPDNINCFIDVFAGSGVVSMNTNADSYIINDIDKNLYQLYQLFKNFTPIDIITHINNRIDEYGLARERTSHKVFKDDRKERYKASYYKFRENYNKTKNQLDFYTLMFYSFSQQFRFNDKNEFNMPCGNDCFSEKNEEYIYNGTKFFSSDNVHIGSINFKNIDIGSIGVNDFVYLDPPYFSTTATYNENSGWSEQDENDLYEFCQSLTDHNVKFGMSNVFENKGIVNRKLIDWCNCNKFNIYSFDKISYSACGKGNSNAKEVFIRNY